MGKGDVRGEMDKVGHTIARSARRCESKRPILAGNQFPFVLKFAIREDEQRIGKEWIG